MRVPLSWLREHVGVTALLSIALTLVLGTAIATYAMWLLPHRAARTLSRAIQAGAAAPLKARRRLCSAYLYAAA